MKSRLELIAPARALGVEVVEESAARVVLRAPLAKNRNDKGSAFAGSIDALLDLAGWAVVATALESAGINADVMIVKSETHYRAAVRSDFEAVAELAPSELERITDELKHRERSRIALTVRLTAAGNECAVANASYAILEQ